jgi:predicted RNA-binding Zn-ribbon protein involved in translation (DUF1610 family)
MGRNGRSKIVGELFIRRVTEKDQVWLCDECGQDGIKANGKEIRANEELVMWFCYNCVEKEKRNAV